MTYLDGLREAADLTDEDRERVDILVNEYDRHYWRNELRNRYYDGKVKPRTLGLSIPDNLDVRVSCGWAAKAVDELARLSRFDSFVSTGDISDLDAVLRANSFDSKLDKSVTSELKHGCSFASVGKRADGSTYVNFHSTLTGAAVWDTDLEHIAYGMVISGYDLDASGSYRPSSVILHTDTDAVTITRHGSRWYADYSNSRHIMGRPMMEPLVYRPDNDKPLGRSRISQPVMDTIDLFLAESVRVAVSSEFYSVPQRYMLGVSDEQYDSLVDNKWKAYIGSMLLATSDPETGDKPTVGQFPQMTMEPHITYMRSLAEQFSQVTNIPVAYLGVTHDNPESAEAMQVAKEPLVAEAESLNAGNTPSLLNIAAMALAVERNVPFSDVDMSGVDVHYANPSTVSIAASADAAVKIVSADPSFAGTDVFYEMLGFDHATIARINEQKRRTAGVQFLSELMND